MSAFRLQALSGDNGGDSNAPSVTDAGDQEDPSVLDVIGEIASGRVAAGVKAEVHSAQCAELTAKLVLPVPTPLT